ncbi:PGPGW domain-containing protein [Shewanella cyperi]|nr:PGPGW domain-containing protein [Shewanella cyperi]
MNKGMHKPVRKTLLTLIGGLLTLTGLILLLMPGPAWLLLPLGLTLLAMEYPWARPYLARSQKAMTAGLNWLDKLWRRISF